MDAGFFWSLNQKEAVTVMKKTVLCALAVLLVSFGSAGAVPIQFQVGTNGSLVENVTSGPGILGIWEALGTGVFDLEEGETSDPIDFFKLWMPFADAEGTVEATIELLSPTPFGNVSNQGAFSVWSIVIFSGGSAAWDSPAPVSYSYNGMSGGLLTLNLFDIPDMAQFGSCYTISGTITNNTSPTPIPAPLVLLGTGLVGLAGFRRKFK